MYDEERDDLDLLAEGRLEGGPQRPEELDLDPAMYDPAARPQPPFRGERAHFILCRSCIWGTAVLTTQEGDEPQYRDHQVGCVLGVQAAADGDEVQSCSGFVPRSLSWRDHLAAWTHRQHVRAAALKENAAGAEHFDIAPWPIDAAEIEQQAADVLEHLAARLRRRQP